MEYPMKKLIELLFDGCWHKWEIIENLPVHSGNMKIGRTMVCRCTKCGMPKRFDLYNRRVYD